MQPDAVPGRRSGVEVRENQEGGAAGGSGAAVDPFAAFYRAEYQGMVRLARALTGGIERAEDVVQEAFARLHGRIDELDNPGGYLRTTVVNLCRDQGRRRYREQGVRHRAAAVVPMPPEAAELVDVLLALPYRQRAVLVMRYWGDWSEAEIAAALGCRPGTVKALASRGLARLRKEIGS
jgi:RNA polymerase sigma-70 factor (sigma-E family)